MDFTRSVSLNIAINTAKRSSSLFVSGFACHTRNYPPRSTVLFAIFNRLSTGRITQETTESQQKNGANEY